MVYIVLVGYQAALETKDEDYANDFYDDRVAEHADSNQTVHLCVVDRSANSLIKRLRGEADV